MQEATSKNHDIIFNVEGELRVFFLPKMSLINRNRNIINQYLFQIYSLFFLRQFIIIFFNQLFYFDHGSQGHREVVWNYEEIWQLFILFLRNIQIKFSYLL